VIIKAIWEKAAVTVTADWAARVREQILGARDIRNPGAYLRRTITTAPRDTYVPAPTPPAARCERCGLPGHDKPECPH